MTKSPSRPSGDSEDLLVAYQHGAASNKDRIRELEAALAEARMQSLADLGQAQDAYEAQRKAEAERDALKETINQMRAIVEADDDATDEETQI